MVSSHRYLSLYGNFMINFFWVKPSFPPKCSRGPCTLELSHRGKEVKYLSVATRAIFFHHLIYLVELGDMEESVEKDAYRILSSTYFALILLTFSSVSRTFSLYGPYRQRKMQQNHRCTVVGNPGGGGGGRGVFGKLF